MVHKLGLLTLLFAFLSLLPSRTHAQYVGCRDIIQITTEECEVLEKLFADTEGEKWFRNEGWLRTNQPCDWFGVTCASTGWPRPITKITLISNNVGGSLPADLSILSQLKELVIENRDAVSTFATLGGDIPLVLSNLSELEVLKLSRNSLRGPVPRDLVNLEKLRVLHLDDNQLSGPIPRVLGNLTGLEELNLSTNSFEGVIPEELANIAPLKHLDLSNNNLEGGIPAALGNLTNLVSLDLQNNNLTGVIPGTLNNFPNLIWLSFSDNNLDGALSLDIATAFAGVNTCFLTNNAPSLCIPDTPPFRALGTDPICGIPLSTTCSSPFFVEIISFEGTVVDDAVVLTWTTDRGSTDIRFDIEQKDNDTFKRIGEIAGAGVDAASQAYTYRVENPGQSPYTFRLKQVDISGTFAYSTELTIQTSPSFLGFEAAFPNPFSENTTLRFSVATEQAVVVRMYNTLGQLVRTLYQGTPPANTSQTLSIAADGLSDGLYFVRLSGAEGFSSTETIQVVK